LVVTKYLAVMTELGASVLWVTLVGLTAGLIAFGFGPLPTLSGSTLSVGAALMRTVGAMAYILIGVAGLAAIGVFLSTLTDSGIGAAVATVSVAIASQILGGISAVRAIHPYLISDQWLAYADLFRTPVVWDGIARGLLLAAVYTALFLAAALIVFTRKDVTS
jgi:ABC-2 type transport system permease protein